MVNSGNFGGVIFDLDGTLANTLQDITNAVNYALSRHGLPTARAEQVKLWVGEGMPVLMRRAAPQADDGLIDSLVEAAAEFYREHAFDNTALYPGIPELLKAVDEAGVLMAVLSNKPQEFTEQMVERLCEGRRFVAVAGYRDEATKKPNPAVALEIASAMRRQPGEVLFVGDSCIDIRTARNAGMPVASVTWGFRPREELVAAEPDYLVDEPRQLQRLLLGR